MDPIETMSPGWIICVVPRVAWIQGICGPLGISIRLSLLVTLRLSVTSMAQYATFSIKIML